jgi:hypothetical protein
MQIIWRPVLLLSRQAKLILKQSAKADPARRMGVYRPSRIIGGTIALLSLLFLAGSLISAWNIFVARIVPPTPLRILVIGFLFSLGVLFFFFALRVLVKWFFHSRYYLYLGDEWLVERNFWSATILPVSSLTHSWRRREIRIRGTDIEFESIMWKGHDGELYAYDLRDHYWHHDQHEQRTRQAASLICSRYGICRPPTGLNAGSKKNEMRES